MPADPFCVKEQTRRTIFYESRHFMLLYDIKPVVKGHFLIVSKRHVLDLLDLTKDEIEDFHDTCKKMVPRLLSIYEATDNSYDVTSQIGPYSGRSVGHLHVHVLPRKKEDFFNRTGKSIFQALSQNTTTFTASDVDAEVARLRKEFKYELR